MPSVLLCLNPFHVAEAFGSKIPCSKACHLLGNRQYCQKRVSTFHLLEVLELLNVRNAEKDEVGFFFSS